MRVSLALAALLTLASGASAQVPAGGSAAGCCTATISVRVPERTGTVYLAGSLPELGPWRPNGLAMTGEGRERTARHSAARDDIRVQVHARLLGS